MIKSRPYLVNQNYKLRIIYTSTTKPPPLILNMSHQQYWESRTRNYKIEI